MTALDRFAALDNPFPPDEELPVGCTADGETYFYDNLNVDTILTALGIPVQTALRED